jgi:hypothetical protein
MHDIPPPDNKEVSGAVSDPSSNLRFLTALAIVLAAAAVRALALLTTHRPAVTVTAPAAVSAAPTEVLAAYLIFDR